MYNTQELLEGNLPPRLERKIEEILSIAKDQKNFATDHARLRLESPTSRREDSAPSSMTLAVNETIKETIFRELICRTRMYIGERILRITEERFRRNWLFDNIVRREDEVTESSDLSEEDLSKIEQILDFFKELLTKAIKLETEKKRIKDLRKEVIANAAKNPESTPWIML